ncbi:hypothetical protein [Frigoribacterium sp. CFBP 13729]|uniref:MmyB family transcriptional regulator n=1 Tax=unclassified Frigoribacterium TaxID=2627005 RepID=UPI00352DB528
MSDGYFRDLPPGPARLRERPRWAAHDVSCRCTGSEKLNHPVVGELELSSRAWSAPEPDEEKGCRHVARRHPSSAPCRARPS